MADQNSTTAGRGADDFGGSEARRPSTDPPTDIRQKKNEAFGRGTPPRQNGAANGERSTAARQHGERQSDVAEQDDQQDDAHQPDARTSNGKPDQRDDARNGPPSRQKKPLYKRPIPLLIGAIVLVGVVVGGLLWWLHARQYESTDDAFIQADITRVAPQVAGRVERVLVNDNQEVHVGDLLAEIRPIDFEVKLQQAQAAQAESTGRMAQSKAQEAVAAANIEQAQAEVTAAEATASQAAADLKRFESLSAEAVSKQQLDQVRATAKTSAAQLDAARRKLTASQAQQKAATTETEAAAAAVTSAQAQVKQAEVQLGYTKIKANVDGWITSKAVAVGDYVQAGQQVLAIVPRDVWVTANYKETQLDHIRPGLSVDIDIDAYPDRTFHGKVQSIQAGSGAAFSLLPPENATGNYVKVVQRVPVKIVFDADSPPNPANTTQPVAPGMSVVPKVKIR